MTQNERKLLQKFVRLSGTANERESKSNTLQKAESLFILFSKLTTNKRRVSTTIKFKFLNKYFQRFLIDFQGEKLKNAVKLRSENFSI